MLTRLLLHGFLVGSLLAGSALTLSAQSSALVADPVAAVAAPSLTVDASRSANVGAPLVRSLLSREASATLPAPQLRQDTDRRNVAWIAVGLAALAAGLLIGGDAGDVVAITGGVIGLVGLFRYMN